MASAHRGSDLVKQLLAFAGGIRGERCPIDVEQLIEETRRLLEHTLPKSIRIDLDVDPDCPQILGEATEVSQILMNLCINARDAMPQGGTLTVEAHRAEIKDSPKLLHPDANSGLHLLIKVADTGCGMSAEILDRIFDPFFTTKEVGKGTGLGLATVQGIVKSHGGFINVYSEAGRGTVFSVYLPALESTEERKPIADESFEVAPPGRTILLVDDEAFILQMTSSALESNGYRVVTARDGASAINAFRQQRNQIDLVLLDMMMPGIDGIETLRQLRRIDPDVIVIACEILVNSERNLSDAKVISD
jgi:CheY-like chemotaxis protein